MIHQTLVGRSSGLPIAERSTQARSQQLSTDLLAALDNYSPEAYDAQGVGGGIDLLRQAGWLLSCDDPDYLLPGHDVLAEAENTFARQLRLLYDVGRGSLPLGRIFEGHVNAVELIHRFADKAQLQNWRSDINAGHLLGVWNTEAGDGLHLHALGKGRFELQGAKTFCSGAGEVTRPIITGQRWEKGRALGWQMLVMPMELVDATRIDGSFWDPLGMQASASYRIDFTGLQVSEHDLLGGVDDYHLQPQFSGGAVRFAGVQLGGARALYDHSLALLKDMHREHDPYQCHRIARMELAHEGGMHWLRLAAQRALPGGAANEEVIHYANMTRTAILQACNEILTLTEEAVGARGFLQPKPIQRIYTDLKMYLRQPAPDNTLAAIGRFAAEKSLLPTQPAPESEDLSSFWPAETELLQPTGHAIVSKHGGLLGLSAIHHQSLRHAS